VPRPTTKRAAKRFSRALKIFRRSWNKPKRTGPTAGAVRNRCNSSSHGRGPALARNGYGARKSTTLKGSELSAVVERAADALESFGNTCKRNCRRCPNRLRLAAMPTFSFSEVALMAYSPEDCWRWDARNGTAQLHLKPTKEIATGCSVHQRSICRCCPQCSDGGTSCLRFLS